MKITILFPVLNEQLRLKKGIQRTVEYMEQNQFADYELLIVDNGSTDKTSEIAEELCHMYSAVKYLQLKRKGVGLAFREGVKNSSSDLVGYMDIDLSTDIRHLKDMMYIFEKDSTVEMVNASRLNKNSETKGRKWYRNITSRGLTVCMKICLNMKASDAICGFKFFKRDAVENLIRISKEEDGWFYIIELLIRAERYGYNIVELPVKWKDEYHTKVHVFPLIKNYLIQIIQLKKRLKKETMGDL